jgi:hypothetical protein
MCAYWTNLAQDRVQWGSVCEHGSKHSCLISDEFLVSLPIDLLEGLTERLRRLVSTPAS